MPHTFLTGVRFFQKPGVLDRNNDGKNDRYAVVLDGVSAWHVRTLALQQEEGLFDKNGAVAFENGEATGAYFGHVLKGKLAS